MTAAGDDQVLELARRLGREIAAHPRAVALGEAQAALEADEVARTLRAEYDAAASALQGKLAHGKPLEPDEKRAESELRQRVASNATLRALVRAQADFHELMVRVNAAIDEAGGT